MSGQWATAGAARTVVRPSPLPELLALGSLVASVLVAYLSGDERILGGIPVLAALAGYALTPFAVVAALAWARTAGLARLDDPWFDRMRLRAQMRRLQVLALLAFGAAVPHVFVLARAIQRALGIGS
jgi:hypothetical protein